MTRNQTAIVAAICLLMGTVASAEENQTSNSNPQSNQVSGSTNRTEGTPVDQSTLVTPPQRPGAITAEQLVALETLADNPKHAVPADTRAAYSPEAAKTMKSLSGPAFYAGYGGTLLWVLIAAAPL
ncbi:MAG: hypothetical protein KDA54_07220 [Phycisphaerales bacterium]|nr:hypothetical protein [Phycisphaerales bacterium]